EINLEVAAGSAAPDVPGHEAFDARRDAGVAWRGGGGWPWIALAFALLWLATLAWALRERAPGWLRRRTAPAPDGPAAGPAMPATSQRDLQRVLQVGDPGEIEQALCGLASPPAPDLDALSQRLADQAQRDAIARLQQARWADGDMADARAALREA